MSPTVCARDGDGGGHDPITVMIFCPHCWQFAVAGYACGCGHEETTTVDKLAGHGVGVCTHTPEQPAGGGA